MTTFGNAVISIESALIYRVFPNAIKDNVDNASCIVVDCLIAIGILPRTSI